MQRKQLIALIICVLGMFTAGTMIVTLIPIHAVQLGMDEGIVGLYVGLAFAIMTIAALASGPISNRFQRRKLPIMVVCALAVPATFMMGQVSDLLLLTFFTLIVWCAAGMATSMINILAGMHAKPHERGRIFGILATTIGVAQVIAGFSAGAIVDRWGFNGLFTVVALIWAVPIFAALFIQDNVVVAPTEERPPKPTAGRLSQALWLLLLANVLVQITSFSMSLARPLMMNELDFDASAISSAVGISALIALPLPFLIAWLSDRVGRRQLLLVSYGIWSLGVLLLLSAFDLWQFWLSASLFSIAAAAGGIANALVTDMSTPETLGTAMSRFSATPWIAGMIGYGATGFIIQGLGLSTTLLIGAALPLLAIGIMLLIMRRSAQPVPGITAVTEP